MKNLCLLLFAISIISCEDPEIKDPIAGKWLYESIDVSQAKSKLKASFTINASGKHYSVSDIVISINGVQSTDFTGEVTTVAGDKIGMLIFRKGTESITLFNCDKLVYIPAWTVDRVELNQNNQIVNYPLQSLKAN